jgi:hypothetical protein
MTFQCLGLSTMWIGGRAIAREGSALFSFVKKRKLSAGRKKLLRFLGIRVE